tara:strand:- start:940 stop:1146 length:207 start_codon:yes stop_codon:yes gene_type:complete
VGCSCDDQDDDECCEHPVNEKFYERELEDIKANIEVELWVFDSEILAVSKQDPVLPSTGGSYAKEEGK